MSMPPSAPPPKRQRKSGGARPRAAAAAAPACAGEGARARVPLTAHAPDLTDADPLLRVAQLRALEEMAAVPATQRAAVAARNTADWNRANRAQHKWRLARYRESADAEESERQEALARYARAEALVAELMRPGVPRDEGEEARSAEARAAVDRAIEAVTKGAGAEASERAEVLGNDAAVRSLSAKLDAARDQPATWETAEELVRAYGEAFGQGAPQPRARALCAQRQPDPAATESMRPVITRVLEPDMTCEEALAATDRVAEL